jgi:hypothetical protein
MRRCETRPASAMKAVPYRRRLKLGFRLRHDAKPSLHRPSRLSTRTRIKAQNSFQRRVLGVTGKTRDRVARRSRFFFYGCDNLVSYRRVDGERLRALLPQEPIPIAVAIGGGILFVLLIRYWGLPVYNYLLDANRSPKRPLDWNDVDNLLVLHKPLLDFLSQRLKRPSGESAQENAQFARKIVLTYMVILLSASALLIGVFLWLFLGLGSS